MVGLVSAISCTHDASLRSGEETVSPGGESFVGPDVVSENPSSPRRNYAGRHAEEAEDEFERTQWENGLLREENERLRAEVIRLQQSLLDANQTIYSLNRKLDAIFKPNSMGE